MQSYTEITSDKTLTESRDMLLNNDKTVMSCFSGTSAPTSNLQVGMFFLNTSTLMLYQLTALTPTWKLIFDLTKTATNQEAVNTKAATSHASTATTYGVSSATNYGHAMASSATPIVAGMGAVGTDNGKFVREGHIHPAQTSVTGNAGTATKLATARKIAGVNFDGSTDIDIPYNALLELPDIAGTHGMIVYATTGTYTFTAPVTGTYFLTVGGAGGAGGAGRYSYTDQPGAGGGSGDLIIDTPLSLIGNSSYIVTIGAGGAGAIDSAGGAGGVTSFSNLVSLSGGGGGGRNTGNYPAGYGCGLHAH